MEGRAIVRAATLEEFKRNPDFAHHMGEEAPAKTFTLYNLTAQQRERTLAEHAHDLRVGHGDRPECLHRLQRLRRRVLCREQHPGDREGAGAPRPRDGLDPHRSLLRRRRGQPGDLPPADALPAVRERALRGRLPCGRDHAQQRRPERHGLQPLRRHALLLEQLPVQGSPVQLPALLGLGHDVLQAAAQPERHGAQPRRHGEVHLLRAAHQPRAAGRRRSRVVRSRTARSRRRASRRARPTPSSSATSTIRTAGCRS